MELIFHLLLGSFWCVAVTLIDRVKLIESVKKRRVLCRSINEFKLISKDDDDFP